MKYFQSPYLFAAGALVLTLAACPGEPPFRIIMLPDTQYYSSEDYGGSHDMFTAQTQWIVDNAEKKDIAYVIHVGDVVYDWNDTDQWDRAKSSMEILDGKVPYAIAVGNHDGLNQPETRTENINQYFPLSLFKKQKGYGGAMEKGKIDNTYHTFQAAGRDWLVLALEFGPRDKVLDWADDIIEDHPEHKVIVATHGHVFWDDTLLGSQNSHGGVPTVDYSRDNDGTDIWDKLLSKHKNVVLVLSGHINGVGRLVGLGQNGNRVYQMLADYSSHSGDGAGGNGWLRIITFDPAEDKLSVETYSPYIDDYKRDQRNQFEYGASGIFPWPF